MYFPVEGVQLEASHHPEKKNLNMDTDSRVKGVKEQETINRKKKLYLQVVTYSKV